MRRHNNLGFTLLELLITLAVIGILASVAIPSFFSFIQNSRLTTDINKIVTSLSLARSEAVKRGVNVRLAATDSSEASNEWGMGWSVWVDLNGDNTIDAGETTLAINQALNSTMELNSTGNNDAFVYRADGSVNVSDTLNLCDSARTGETGRSITLNANGRVDLNSVFICP